MLHRDNEILKSFEREVWLYTDGELPQSRLKYWDEMINGNSSIKEYYYDLLSTLNETSLITGDDLPEDKFDAMIKKSLNGSKGFLGWFGSRGKDFTMLKIAFGSALTVLAMIFLLASNKPNPINNISDELLKWNSDEIDDGIQQVDYRLRELTDDEITNYILYKLQNDEWKREMYEIGDDIKDLDEEIQKKSM